MSDIRSFVYFNGSKNIGPNGLSFDGEKRGILIVPAISFEELHEKICKKLKLQQNQVISSVTGRVLHGNYYVGFEISDDEDVDVFFQTFKENSASQFAELYVDIETLDEGVQIPTHGLNQSHYMLDEEPDNEEEQEEEDEDTLLSNDHEQNDSDTDEEYHHNPMPQQTGMV